MMRSKSTSQRTDRNKLEKKVRQHQSTLRLFSQVEIPSGVVRDLLRSAEYGDIPTVQELLAAHPHLDTNAPDPFGRTALQIAVSNEHAEIVELLLPRSSPANIYLALLLAINHNYENVTEMILVCPTYRQYHNRWQELAAQLPDTSPFSDDVSPIILACQKNLFGIVHLLLQDGMRVPVPHHFDCACEACQVARQEDQLKHAKRRLNEYRALTSEAYISLTSPDPFQTAFELCHEMELRATWEKHFKKEYKALIALMRRYVVKLLDCIRTHDELQTILNWSGGMGAGTMSTATGDTVVKKRQAKLPPPSIDQLSPQPLARLRVAIHYHQKEFVSHWACQQELMRRWLRGFTQYQGSSSPTKIFTNMLLIMLCYPILIVFHWVLPDSKWGRMLTKPMVKFVAYSMSYLFFLGILFIITITPTGFYGEGQRLSSITRPPEAYQPLSDIVAAVKGYALSAPLPSLRPHQSSFSAGLGLDDGLELQPENDDGAHRNTAETLYDVIKDFCNDSLAKFPQHDIGGPVVDQVGQLSSAGVQQICKLDKDFILRPHADNFVCWIVSIWLFGLLCRKARRLFRGNVGSGIGHSRWSVLPAIFRSPFDMIDFAQLAFFAAAFGSRFYAYLRVTESVVFFLSVRPSQSTLAVFPNHLYWLPSDRVFYHSADPLTISELLFAVGGVFSFARLLYIFPALEVFGPCYLALMRVVKDIFAFSFVFMVVFAAFMIGTLNIYWYFNPNLRNMLQLNETYQPEIPAEKRFGNLELTFRTVFWSLFGLGESDYMSVNDFANGSMIWVERVGYIIYGAYNVVVVCVLLNMLIAMMAKSYDVIKANSEMEWKFARTILFLEYIPDNTPAIPTPFNLLPNPRYLWEMICNLYEAMRPQKRLNRPAFCSPMGEDVAGEMGRHPSHRTASSDDLLLHHRVSVTAPVQIRIEAGDETATIDEADDEDDAFTVDIQPASPTDKAPPKPPMPTAIPLNASTGSLAASSATAFSRLRLPTTQASYANISETEFGPTPQPTPTARRIDRATMTSDADETFEETTSCCNFCFLSKCFPDLASRNSGAAKKASNVPQTASAGGWNVSATVRANRMSPGVQGRRATHNPALLKFRAVVFNILRRYILGLSTQSGETLVDLEEIKQDISSFRFEVLNLLSSGFDERAGVPVAAMGPTAATSQTSVINSSINRPRMTRSAFFQQGASSSPSSIKSLSENNADASRINNASASNLLMVSPSHRLMTPTSDIADMSTSSPQNPSPAASFKSPRITRPFGGYRRRHSLLPSSFVGSLIPVASPDDEDEQETASATSGSGTVVGTDESSPRQQRSPFSSLGHHAAGRSPARPSLAAVQRSFSNDTSQQVYLEEVSEDLEDTGDNC